MHRERSLLAVGEDLIKIRTIDCSGLDPRIKETQFTVMCDVTNPLCGENGSTYTFGKQKGGTPEILDELEAGMRNYRDLLAAQFGVDMDQMPGAGAAGGLGAALMAFLNAQLKSGIETVLDLIEFDKKLEGVSLVVTGERKCGLAVRFRKGYAGGGNPLYEPSSPGSCHCGKYGKRGRADL